MSDICRRREKKRSEDIRTGISEVMKMAPFKKMRGIRLPYRKQGKIYFTLINYDDQPKNVQNRIDRLIEDAADHDAVYCAALRRWLLNENVSFAQILTEYPVSEPTLYRLRKKVYEAW